MNTLKFFLKLFLFLMIIDSCNPKEQNFADMVVLHADIWTGNPGQPIAQALAIIDDTIVAIGSDQQMQPWVGENTSLIDAENHFITPGFIDSHIHFITGGFRLSSVQLRDAKTKDEFIERIKNYAQSIDPGTWITGGDWDHKNWGGELPQRDWIDQYTPHNPVWINRLDGHMALANTTALKEAGVQASIQNIEGGEIVRDINGVLTGIFKDNAMLVIDRVVPEPNDQQKDRAMEAAMDYVAAQGVTSVHNMSGNIDVFEKFRDQKKLKTRIYAGMPINQWAILDEKVKKEGFGDHWLRIGVLKGFMDGSLGSHTAAFFKPFTDNPTDSGILVTDPSDMYQWISSADSAGLQTMIHAIGDRAISQVLDIYKKVEDEHGVRDRRFRIEHAQHITPDDIRRFNDLQIIASMQPYHAIDDGRWAEKVIGPERIKTTYAFRSLLDNGVKLCFGSDWFVAPPTPLEGIYAAVTRRTLDGKNPDGWVPEQKITVEEALKAYTIGGAYASFEENIKGSLEPGKLADFVMIDQNLKKIQPEDIAKSKILLTIVGGNIVFDHRNF